MSGGAHLDVADLAHREGVPLATVYRWNSEGTGPAFMRIGRHVRYRLTDVEAWEQQRVVATRAVGGVTPRGPFTVSTPPFLRVVKSGAYVVLSDPARYAVVITRDGQLEVRSLSGAGIAWGTGASCTNEQLATLSRLTDITRLVDSEAVS